MEPGLSDQDDAVEPPGSGLHATTPQWSLVFPTRMTAVICGLLLGFLLSPQWSLVFPTRMTSWWDRAARTRPQRRNGAWSFRPG